MKISNLDSRKLAELDEDFPGVIGPLPNLNEVFMNQEEKQEVTLSLEEFREKTGIEDENELLREYQEYLENVQLLKE